MNPRNPTPPLEIESLLTADERRVSIDEHAQFRDSISSLAAFYQIDEAVACFRPIQRKSNREISRLDSIFDEILVEQLRSRSFEETAAKGWAE